VISISFGAAFGQLMIQGQTGEMGADHRNASGLRISIKH